MELSVAEKRLLKALHLAGGNAAADAVGFDTAGEALRAAGGPERHGLLEVQETRSASYELTAEGARAQAEGLPERKAIQAILASNGGIAIRDLGSHPDVGADDARVAVGQLKRKGWASIDKGNLVASGDAPPLGPDEESLQALAGEGTLHETAMKDLVGRGLVAESETVVRAFSLTEQGAKVAADIGDIGEEVNQITPELIARWAEMTDDEKDKVHIRGFDFDVDVAPRHGAKPHPLTQLMMQTRDIFWRMGFQEISGDYVESAFWNMDALFIPQDHPAREMQDTFYLENPRTIDVDAEDLARGEAIHKHGGDTESTGWGGDFSQEVSQQALLRTHTTNTTVRYLRDNPTGIHKVFGLGKVFRKETMDATHLPEFYQIEGIVTEPNADFDMLVGLCRAFFTRMGFPEVRFRPAYFPYTEPSMEIDVMYNGKWMELGGCGIFRPEVTEPLGVEHPVLAWGFGLERLAMMRLGLKDIRDLYISDTKWLKEQPLM